MANYGHIKYDLPTGSPRDYAGQALEVLHDLSEAAPRSLPTFMKANTVLTLSGVRIYDTYSRLPGHLTDDERQAASGTLETHGVTLLPAADPLAGSGPPAAPASQFDKFDLIHADGPGKLWNWYGLPWPEDRRPHAEPSRLNDPAYMTAWSHIVEHSLASMMEDNRLPRRWLHDWWSPHNIRFGMLMGYPAKAIESYLNQPPGPKKNMSSYRWANIKYDSEYDAHRPVYIYHASLKADPEIVDHQRLWSGILKTVYTSGWHKRLRNDTIFQETLAENERTKKGSKAHRGQ